MNYQDRLFGRIAVKSLVVFAVLCSCLIAVADPELVREDDFFGIPDLDSLSNRWIMQITNPRDTTDYSPFYDWGFIHPVDVEVLKLSASDYRLVVLDAIRVPFTVLKIDQMSNVILGEVTRTGSLPPQHGSATAMCQMKQGEYFDPQTDRVAVACKTLNSSAIGISRFIEANGHFVMESMFTSDSVTSAIGLFWAFGDFFVVNEETQSIVRLDYQHNVRSIYGSRGIGPNQYRWISDISGYVGLDDVIHLYVSDGLNGRVDHLITTQHDPDIHLHSQARAWSQDGRLCPVHEVEYVPGVGVVGFDRSVQRLFIWDCADSLQNGNLESGNLPSLLSQIENPTLHMQQACGRLIFITLADTGFFTLRSYRVNSAIFDNPSRGDVLEDETWSGTAYVGQHLTVATGATLTITPSTTIKVAPDVSIFVYGTIIAQGTEEAPIIFECSDSTQRWNRLRIYSDDPENVLEHVIIRDANTGVLVGNGLVNLDHVTVENCWIGAVLVNAAGSVIRGSTFRNNERYGVWIVNDGVTFDYNAVQDNGEDGIRLWRVPFLRLDGNIVSDNGFTANEGSGSGVNMLRSAANLQML